MDSITQGFPVFRYLLELAQTHVHWVGDTIQPSHPLSLPPPPPLNLSQHQGLFASAGQSIGASVSASVLPVNIWCWFPLGWAGWISLQSKGLSRVFSNTTVQKHWFFSAQPSLWSNSHIRLPWWRRWWSICLQCGRLRFDPWVRKIPWRRKWQPTPVLLLGKSHGQKSLIGYSPWGRKESHMTEQLHLC